MRWDDRTKKQILNENTGSTISPDTYVWRIFSATYLEEDLKDDCMTLVMPCWNTQNDILENPLRDALFKVDGQKYKLFLDMMSQYYTQSWSLRPDIDWNYFGTQGDKVRVKCKAAVLFDRLVSLSDKYYRLNYHMDRIEYKKAQEIKDKFSNNDFDSFLDSSGSALVETIMTLQGKYISEEEIRLLYIYRPQSDNMFPTTHRIHGNIKQFCAHVLDWQDTIEEYEFCPSNSADNSGLIKWLAAYGAKDIS